jgi:fatty acid desaturase
VFPRSESALAGELMAALLRFNRIEWPTVGLIAVVYAVLAALVWFHAVLPWWVILPVGAYCVALHSSLQHEVLHGHPTRNRLLNEALVFVAATFWLPFGSYRDAHLKHHNDQYLTCPVNDPESFYMLPEAWAEMPGVKRTLFTINQTLGGRMLIGPLVTMIQFWWADLPSIVKGDAQKIKHWLLFSISCGLTLTYIIHCGMPVWQYILLVAYPGISLALVRSYCEHQAAEDVGERTIIVEASAFWSLLFLNNNLHVAHHTRPNLPWYELPAYYRSERDALIKKNNGYLMRGYAEIFRRYLLTPKEQIPHPNTSWIAAR